MTQAQALSTRGQPYELVTISNAKPPPGQSGADWHAYEIAQGKNVIRGCRRGPLKDVTLAVEDMVEQLNERRLGRYGRAKRAPAAKK